MKTKKLLTIIVLITIVLFAYGSASMAIKLSDKDNAYLGGLIWHKSLDKGLEIAQKENKPVLVYFWAIWCQYCEKFETETLPQPEITKMLKEDYVLVAIDLDEDKNTPGKFGVSYPPYELFLDPKGNVLNRQPGFVDANTFLPIITQVRDNYNKGQ